MTKTQNKRPIGRPSKLAQEHLDGAAWYLKGGFEERNEVIPSIAGLACFLGVDRRQIYDWGEQNPDFGSMLEAIKAAQEVLLLNNGLRGNFNATITKLALFNHGYSDKIENAVSGGISLENKVADLTDEELAAELAKYGLKP